jgi:hypothetical protein
MTDQEKAAHLAMIQGVVNRMATNSFGLKTMAVAVTAASAAYYGAVAAASWVVAAGVWVALFVLWLLDAKYLQLERLFRKLYDGVRTGSVVAGTGKPVAAYDMNFAAYRHEVHHVARIAVSWSVLWLYLALAIFIGALIYARPAPKPNCPAPAAQTAPAKPNS